MKVWLFVLLFCGTAWSQSATLLWDPNSETDLAGYKVYWGTAPGTYGPPTEVPGTPSAPTFTVTGLQWGSRYYFAVTAYNTSGLESGFSNEVTALILSIPTITIEIAGGIHEAFPGTGPDPGIRRASLGSKDGNDHDHRQQ